MPAPWNRANPANPAPAAAGGPVAAVAAAAAPAAAAAANPPIVAAPVENVDVDDNDDDGEEQGLGTTVFFISPCFGLRSQSHTLQGCMRKPRVSVHDVVCGV